ncbi:hypothetical protein L226DRAFT_574419 [Lentinus tigrinus ALCF2SS1-7]|uniref:Uncharacterized protein n=1 Tax=Lentinus tigrinus ALCF2SS1-6 TaxID=1328759 RepID=A0A5C2RKF5_9APHY|nr:hypothetical protein L227DRAFT_618096 [Lentinus tigrinus ALCF2SS1-6]RPD70982.1 hypothetical protein L226DRAFT_574419 [Lentinus tigrinus ALCF2SS1-7]
MDSQEHEASIRTPARGAGDVFPPDSRTFVELLMRIQTLLIPTTRGLVTSWAEVCQALGQEFEPYLPVVMPPLLRVANSKADISIYEEHEDLDSWESISLDGRQVGMKTSALEDKCQAFETLLVHASTLNARFGPYVAQVLGSRCPDCGSTSTTAYKRHALCTSPFSSSLCARADITFVPPCRRLFLCRKHSGTLTQQMVTATFSQIINCIWNESDASFLASLFKCFFNSMLVIRGPQALAPEPPARAARCDQAPAAVPRRRRWRT